VRPSVALSQNADRREVVDLVHAYFLCGTIRRDSSDRTVKWEVRSLRSIVDSVLPHFDRWPLLSGKQSDVALLARVCLQMEQGEHLRPQGLIEIARLASTMNPSGIRRYEIEEIETSIPR
jgi:hypothetical protein